MEMQTVNLLEIDSERSVSRGGIECCMKSEAYMMSVLRQGSACVCISECGDRNSSQLAESDTSQQTPPARLLHLYPHRNRHNSGSWEHVSSRPFLH